MELLANNKVPNYEHRLFKISDVFWMRDQVAIHDPKFTRALKKSLDENGMQWPPIVWTQETFERYAAESGGRLSRSKPFKTDFTYRVAIGNNRFYYAVNEGYTHIECVIAEKWQDRLAIDEITRMKYYEDF